MGEQMGVPTRNAYEMDQTLDAVEDAVTTLAERVGYLEAWAKSQGLLIDPVEQEGS